MQRGKACVITAGFFMESLEKLPFVSAEPRAGPVINPVRVTNVARQANRRNPVLLLEWGHPRDTNR
jgi:hypothetical protein